MPSSIKSRRNKRKKRKGYEDDGTEYDAAPSSAFDGRVFPILLAAATAQTNRQEAHSHRHSSSPPAAATARLLRRLLFRFPPPPSPLPISLVALLPILLSSRCSSVAARSCEVVGAAALQSMEASEMLASDSGIANGLAQALGSSIQGVAEAACNAIMDLCASSVGRARLEGSPVLPRLLYLFSQVKSISGDVGSRRAECSRKASRKTKFLCLVIDTAVLMINASKISNLHRLQPKLVKKVLTLFCKIWDEVRGSTMSTDGNCWKNDLLSREHELSEAIFRLSMDLAYPAHLEPDDIRRGVFGSRVSNFENFVLNYWEEIPHLYRTKLRNPEEKTAFAALLNDFDSRTPDTIIDSLMQGVVSCPAIASDEVDINSFLHEVHGSLGAAIKYRQDIRVVRTQEPYYGTSGGYGMEEHFFDDGIVYSDAAVFIEKCKDAFKNGFSIALRGMEFRSEKVAAIAVALADLFGQPSVGANIYFSPPNSQGLARHYDDHCVLVWQLFGRKKWRIWPHPKSILPRLYEPFESLDGLADDSSGSMEVLLEGDMLYIPRGYVHEAHTTVNGDESQVNASADCSLHLTLAIEIEPPFEWGGFAHIALHCWTEKQKLASSQLVHSESKESNLSYAILLHVAIRLLAGADATFRKACMVAAKLPSQSCTTTHFEAIRSNQKSTFDQVISRIDENCSFTEALSCIERAVKEQKDEHLQWMSWLRHLPQHGDVSNRIDYCNILGVLEELLGSFSSKTEEALSGFAAFKSKFCRCVSYDDACESFEALLKMYRRTRNQYMNGMLALHRTH